MSKNNTFIIENMYKSERHLLIPFHKHKITKYTQKNTEYFFTFKLIKETYLIFPCSIYLLVKYSLSFRSLVLPFDILFIFGIQQ